MGYYTTFRITVHGADTQEKLDAITNALKDLKILDYAVYSDGATINYPVYESCDAVKWYDESDDMIALSKMFPDMTFMVEGDGEESLDFWKSYYKNGNVETCMGYIKYDNPVYVEWFDDWNR